ncbi:MAG TPA: hypothetical protein VLA19_16530 [Herpetosiphonaceae bacterium]|nr:hypothetical protein [Herpetosiphonaceae bacterium]
MKDDAMNVPATRSILSADALGAGLPARYELGLPITCRLISGGVNDTYLVTAAGRLAMAGLEWGFCHGDLHAENARLS